MPEFDETINLDESTETVETETPGATTGPDDGSQELANLEKILSGEPVEKPEGTVDPGTSTQTETTTEKPTIDEEAILKAKGLPYKSFDELLGKHKELESNYANRLQPLNWAAKNQPELLSEFYQKLDNAMKKAQGLPVPETVTNNQAIEDEFSKAIDPNTGEPYSQDQIDMMVKMVDAAAKRAGYLKKQDYEGEKAAVVKQQARETAIKAYGDFKGAWEPKLKEMGLDIAKVEDGMEKELAIYGITPETIDRVTPELLGRALNNYLISVPGGLEILMKNYAASTQTNSNLKKGKAAVIPKGGSRTDAEVPTGRIDALLERGDFKGAEAILAKQIEEMYGRR